LQSLIFAESPKGWDVGIDTYIQKGVPIRFGFDVLFWHALWVYAHFIRNIFTDSNCISHHGSAMYYVCFWGSIIISAIIDESLEATKDLYK